ncbi:MAG: ABC transporter permease [Chloroflexi bacterium]|nr:ABC transporter permease [Chloroflexota bacterium]
MKMQTTMALVAVELKKLYRDPMTLGVLLLMPVGLTFIFYLALGDVSNDSYSYSSEMSHFEYLLPGVMGYAIIYMGMIVALTLVEYRKSGLLKRVQATPVSSTVYLGSHIIANMIIATAQGLIVLLVARLLGFEPLGGLAGLLLAALFLALLAIAAVGLGLITASVSKDSGAAGGLSVIFIVPMMMFGALLAVFNETTRNIARFMPNYYVSDSLSVIFHMGRLSDTVIWQNLLILMSISLVVVVTGIQLFKKTAFQSTAAAPTVITKGARLFFVDNLRSALVILVVLHHIALVYGASVPGYYYVEPPFTDPKAFMRLLAFVLVNQSWFMGAFFLLAGYFTPASFDRKGVGAFLRERLLRLGIPLVVFTFILSPVALIGYWLMPASLTGIMSPLTWESFRQAYPDFIGMGPLWFVALLLIFSFGYAGWRMVNGRQTLPEMRQSSAPGYLGTAVFILLLAGTSYLMRMVVPIGKSVLQFPTLAYLPQYLSFFVLGAIAYRKDWLRTLPDRMGIVGFAIALAAGIFLFPWAFSGQLFSLELSEALESAMGNGTWQSAVYTLWDSTFAVGFFIGLIALFRRFVNRQDGLEYSEKSWG